ncbi:hypothetical protein [Rhodocista pekingensis]|uniref:Lipocalin-like domain-containing protein n=1 Tax=Rhodocista pekingensis TaxID=201185 RepID=A0ABW2KZV4_9PROT
MRRFWMVLAMLAGLAACDGGTKNNPLIGSWRMVPETGNPLSEGLGLLMQGQTVEFRADTMIAAGTATRVGYDVQGQEVGDRIIVFPEGSSTGDVYVVLEGGRIANELPLGQRIVFERVR